MHNGLQDDHLHSTVYPAGCIDVERARNDDTSDGDDDDVNTGKMRKAVSDLILKE